MLIALEQRELRGDVIGCVLLFIALASHPLGLAFAVPRTRFRPDTRLDRGGQHVGCPGGRYGEGPARRARSRRQARGALVGPAQGGGCAAALAGRVARPARPRDRAAGGTDRRLARGLSGRGP
jgi:hypothetical protein